MCGMYVPLFHVEDCRRTQRWKRRMSATHTNVVMSGWVSHTHDSTCKPFFLCGKVPTRSCTVSLTLPAFGRPNFICIGWEEAKKGTTGHQIRNGSEPTPYQVQCSPFLLISSVKVMSCYRKFFTVCEFKLLYTLYPYIPSQTLQCLVHLHCNSGPVQHGTPVIYSSHLANVRNVLHIQTSAVS